MTARQIPEILKCQVLHNLEKDKNVQAIYSPLFLLSIIDLISLLITVSLCSFTIKLTRVHSSSTPSVVTTFVVLLSTVHVHRFLQLVQTFSNHLFFELLSCCLVFLQQSVSPRHMRLLFFFTQSRPPCTHLRSS